MTLSPSALIAMSGGVDSSVTAWLMQQQGYRCVGATMRLHRQPAVPGDNGGTCGSAQDILDAAQAAARMQIPHEVLDCTGTFDKLVIEKFIRTYEAGGTPNPCIDCNREMKFAGTTRRRWRSCISAHPHRQWHGAGRFWPADLPAFRPAQPSFGRAG